MKQVFLYTKQGCPLCEEAKNLLEELKREFEFQINEIDIYQDDALLEKYQLMIPVVEVDGEVVAFGKVEKYVLRKRLLESTNVD